MWTAISGAVALYFDKYKSQFLIGGLALLAVIGVSLFAFFDIKHKESMAVEIATQRIKLEMLEKQAKMIQTDQNNILKQAEILQNNVAQIRKEAAERQKVIESHDLDKIGAKHPKVLENRINKATRDQFKRFEEITK